MIASLTGTVAQVALDRAVVDVGGVGHLVHATPSTLAGLRVGERTLLHTTLVVREDSLTLYGFADTEEREVFETAQSVSGVGPRIALAMLAVLTPSALRRAVADEDTAALRRVPGIGTKSAQRIVLELSGRLGAPTDAAGTEDGGTAPTGGDGRDQVVEALVGLGWSAKIAEGAVDKALAEAGTERIAAADVPAVLRAALRQLGPRHG
ncbi:MULTISPECIES: Holliday junction branch migration protein RuvA [Isoptericola]|uniref:Holliday junction branch migration complex subunit RuvA n=1 Tax=Isoptericola sediminis TaxID=2733572 RepID=A0A849JZI0_9MICO|nr:MULTISPECIES: Holliday junction branch migration protein RuvA [Isoptericola]MDO8145072.1 Holliday junction branch migration protein RuvA [Isoptericola sp. 178]MDO8148706.1 Holliday junction branch migration protein RuvA [Isoptericola sp. b515]MDO8151348.1 Holliday junction branch migration protein RuvA [Isoptericola sp. b408]NNU28696.1 Holliday junction branch migration protein RuvA [Isoptericola sediminis]